VTDFISLALSTGLGPVIALVITFIMMGIVYKMAGTIPSILTGIVSTFAFMFLSFLPLMWGLGIIFAFIAGLLYIRIEPGG